ncbi:MAG: hybrid sensor histidine kinase/response regulator [Terrimicrobiaceae bacterium]|nr:hybrid sensor histidine kinase/response regulator [Terrimicrobiaceae bacterium]
MNLISECRRRKLLVVDDESLVRQTLSLILQDEYEVTAVSSGEEAIEASLREPFPVVILDLCMEGLSGIETLQRLKEIRQSQNVIILTAFESTETAIAALNLGAFNYLTKPFERAHLKEVVSRGFDLYEQQSLRKQDMQRRLMGVHDSFFSLLCHEFNTPLNIILGFSEMLSHGASDPEHSAWSRHITEAGNHLHNILMEIVDYIAASHMAVAGIEKEFVPRTLLQPIVAAPESDEAMVEIVNSPAAETTFLGPSDAIFMIARKLVRMASRHSKRVRIATLIDVQDGPNLQIVVSGAGIGSGAIKEKEIGKLFEPYQFTSANDSSHAMSLGLELATCRKIAEYAHASVEGIFNPRGELDLLVRAPVKIIKQA